MIPIPFDWLAQPTLRPGVNYFAGLSPCALIETAGEFRLYYIQGDGLRADGEPANRALHLAASGDGLNFSPLGTVISHKSFAPGADTGESGVFSAAPFVDEAGAFGPAGRTYMYVGAMHEFAPGQVNNDVKIFTSDDGLNFTGRGIVLAHDDPNVTNSADEISPLGVFLRASDGKLVLFYQSEGSGSPAWSPNVAVLSGPFTAESTVNVKIDGSPAGANTSSNGGMPVIFGNGVGAVAVGPAHGAALVDWHTFLEDTPDFWTLDHTDPASDIGSFTTSLIGGRWYRARHTADWPAVNGKSPEIFIESFAAGPPPGPPPAGEKMTWWLDGIQQDTAIQGTVNRITRPGGQTNAGISFDGATHVDAGIPGTSLPSWTYAAWIKGNSPTSAQASGPIHLEQTGVLSWDHPSGAWRLTAAMQVAGNWTSASFIGADPVVWTHYAMTYDAATGLLTAYVNKIQVSQVNAGSPADVQGDSLTFGKASFGGAYWTGGADEVNIFTGALSGAEIAAL